jgi:hypothetical protein
MFKTKHHFPITGHTVYHLGLDVGSYISGRSDSDTGFVAGSRLSFPFTSQSELNIFGYPTNQFLAKDAQILTQRVTRSIAHVERLMSPWVPLYLQRMSAGLVLQFGHLSATESGHQFPWSVGLEAYQDFTLGHLFPMRASVGIYQGDPGLNGQTQAILSFDSKM